MIKKLRIESVKNTGEKDNFGNPKSIIKVYGDDAFYVSASAKILDMEGQEADFDVTEYTAKSGKPYYRVKLPPKDGFQASSTSPKAPSTKNEETIIREVAYKGLVDLIAAKVLKLDDLELMLEHHVELIKGDYKSPSEGISDGKLEGSDIDTTTEKTTTEQISLDDIPF